MSILTAVFQVNLGYPWFFLFLLFWKRIFVDKLHTFLWSGLEANPPNSV